MSIFILNVMQLQNSTTLDVIFFRFVAVLKVVLYVVLSLIMFGVLVIS